LFDVLKQHKHKEHDKTTWRLTSLCVFLCLPCHRVAQRLTTFCDILHGLHHCPLLLEPHIICQNHKKIGSSQFYFILASQVITVIAINYYNCMIQTPKGFFFWSNGDLCGGGGCHYPLVFFLWFFWFQPNTMGRLTHHKKLIDLNFFWKYFHVLNTLWGVQLLETSCILFFNFKKKKLNLTIWCNFFIF